jgi:hypothetical protein
MRLRVIIPRPITSRKRTLGWAPIHRVSGLLKGEWAKGRDGVRIKRRIGETGKQRFGDARMVGRRMKWRVGEKAVGRRRTAGLCRASGLGMASHSAPGVSRPTCKSEWANGATRRSTVHPPQNCFGGRATEDRRMEEWARRTLAGCASLD